PAPSRPTSDERQTVQTQSQAAFHGTSQLEPQPQTTPRRPVSTNHADHYDPGRRSTGSNSCIVPGPDPRPTCIVRPGLTGNPVGPAEHAGPTLLTTSLAQHPISTKFGLVGVGNTAADDHIGYHHRLGVGGRAPTVQRERSGTFIPVTGAGLRYWTAYPAQLSEPLACPPTRRPRQTSRAGSTAGPHSPALPVQHTQHWRCTRPSAPRGCRAPAAGSCRSFPGCAGGTAGDPVDRGNRALQTLPGNRSTAFR